MIAQMPMMRLIRFALMTITVLSANISAFSQKMEPTPVSIGQLLANPLKYDMRVVRVNGHVLSNRSGVGLASQHGAIRLRAPDRAESPMVQRDRLNREFWKMVKSEIGPNQVKVELDGLIRVSKGKTPIDYLGKWPVVELVPVHIIQIGRTGK